MTRRIAAAVIATLIAVVAASAWARETVTIIDYKDRRVTRTDRATLTPERVQKALIAALLEKKWTITENVPGRMLASQSWNNKHTMVVEIGYTGSTYSVVYHGSVNLNYFRYGKEGPEIHPAYNKRVKELLEAIESELQRT